MQERESAFCFGDGSHALLFEPCGAIPNIFFPETSTLTHYMVLCQQGRGRRVLWQDCLS